MDQEWRDAIFPPSESKITEMQEFRKANKERNTNLCKKIRQARKAGTLPSGLLDFKDAVVVVLPKDVKMETMAGTDKEKEDRVEELYHNAGMFLNPQARIPPSIMDRVGRDFVQNARGIYYYHFYNPKFVTLDRKVWVPSLDCLDKDDPSEADRMRRARIFAAHVKNNETWKKSEYAWEADAWSDVFGRIRDDPILTMDKHKYHTELQKTHEVFKTLDEESGFVKRIPDVSIGLATFPDRSSSVFAEQLHRNLLEKLLLHPKCGLMADPAYGHTDIAFPFAAYEAKGWDGDCREARRQSCLAASVYLDLLDNLARTPGPLESYQKRTYQTSTSQNYQVFALTSFGAHWHVLVGYRRPRVDNSASCGNLWLTHEPNHFAGEKGMSDNVYIFQRIWSGRISDESKAWELLSIIDQIHNWAITDHRAFVLEHLKSWNQFSDENFLLNWDSVYNRGKKYERILSDSHDLQLPVWTKHISKIEFETLQNKAKLALAKARIEAKDPLYFSTAKEDTQWHCLEGDCQSASGDGSGAKVGSFEAFLDHLQIIHRYSGELLRQIREEEHEFHGRETRNKLSQQKLSDQRAVGSAQNGIRRFCRQYEAKHGVDRAKAAITEDARRTEVAEGSRSAKRRKLVSSD